MCIAVQVECSCGGQFAAMHHMNGVLPEQAVLAVHCPECTGVTFDPQTMLRDNGWVIEYDMDVARNVLGRELSEGEITPERVFDEGYATWNGLTPTDVYDKAFEMNELVTQTQGDKRRYITEMRSWTQTRTQRLADEGWRKARLAL